VGGTRIDEKKYTQVGSNPVLQGFLMRVLKERCCPVLQLVSDSKGQLLGPTKELLEPRIDVAPSRPMVNA